MKKVYGYCLLFKMYYPGSSHNIEEVGRMSSSFDYAIVYPRKLYYKTGSTQREYSSVTLPLLLFLPLSPSVQRGEMNCCSMTEYLGEHSFFSFSSLLHILSAPFNCMQCCVPKLPAFLKILIHLQDYHNCCSCGNIILYSLTSLDFKF